MVDMFNAKENRQRPSGERQSLAHAIDHWSSDTVDHVLANFPESSFHARLIIFEDNETVFLKIIQGRSPKLRHVSRTHRADLDWLFARFNLDDSLFPLHVCAQPNNWLVC